MSILRDRHQYTVTESGIRRMRSRHVLMHALRRKMLHEVADDILPLSFTEWSHDNLFEDLGFPPDRMNQPPVDIVRNPRGTKSLKFRVRILPDRNNPADSEQITIESDNEVKARNAGQRYDGNHNYLSSGSTSIHLNNAQHSRKYLQDNRGTNSRTTPSGFKQIEPNADEQKRYRSSITFQCNPTKKSSSSDDDEAKFDKTPPRPGFEPAVADYSLKHRCSGDGAEIPDPVKKEITPISIPVYHVTNVGTFVKNVTSSEDSQHHNRPYVRRIRLPDSSHNRNVKIRVALPRTLSSSGGDCVEHASREETVTNVPPRRDASVVSSNVNNRTNNGLYSIVSNSTQLKKHIPINYSIEKIMCDENENLDKRTEVVENEVTVTAFEEDTHDSAVSTQGGSTEEVKICAADRDTSTAAETRKSAARSCILRNLKRPSNSARNNNISDHTQNQTLTENRITWDSDISRDTVLESGNNTILSGPLSTNEYILSESDNNNAVNSNDYKHGITSCSDIIHTSLAHDDVNLENNVIKTQVFTASVTKNNPSDDDTIHAVPPTSCSLESAEKEKRDRIKERSRDESEESYVETDSTNVSIEKNMSAAVLAGINRPGIYTDKSVEFGSSYPEESTSFSNVFSNYSRANEFESTVPSFYGDLGCDLKQNIKQSESELFDKGALISESKKLRHPSSETLQETLSNSLAEKEIVNSLKDTTSGHDNNEKRDDLLTYSEHDSCLITTEHQFTASANKPSSPANNKSESRLSSKIPRFHFPNGRPCAKGAVESTVKKIEEVFDKLGKEKLTRRELGPIAIACGLSEYWRAAIFNAASNYSNTNTVTRNDVITMWKKVTSSNHDDASRFVSMLAKKGKRFLEFEDFLVLLQDIVECHPGLVFLRDAPEFHTRYMKTVIARIFYQVNRSWSGQITVNEMRKSNFLTTLAMLDDEEDINAITEYFSYEHFYVIYCKFWELDMDHDLVIDKLDFLRHSNGALSSRLIDRVLCGAVTRWDASDHQSGKMSYVDFVWFLISEEDKMSQTSIEYWFRCMDLDGDGMISMYEMEFFYEEQMRKLEQLDIEPLPFEDCICQMLDMVKPLHPDFVTLKDLKNCKMANVFFDTFCHVEKYLEHEQKDPFAPPKEQDSSLCEPTDWEKYAAEEYEILVAEEQANDQVNNMDLTYEEEEIDPLVEEELRNLGIVTNMASLGTQGHHLADGRKRYSVEEANALDTVKS